MEEVKFRRLFDDFTGEISPKNIEEWTRQVLAWEQDDECLDPYYIAPSGEYLFELKGGYYP